MLNPAPVDAASTTTSSTDGRARGRRIASTSTSITGSNLISSSVMGTHKAVPSRLDTPSLSTIGVPTSLASAVRPRKPVSHAPTKARQPIVRTGPATIHRSASVHSCAKKSSRKTCTPPALVMRGSDAITVSTEIASPIVDTRFITRVRVASEAERDAYVNATLSPIAAPTITINVDGPSGITPAKRASTALSDTATLAPAMSARVRSVVCVGDPVTALIIVRRNMIRPPDTVRRPCYGGCHLRRVGPSVSGLSSRESQRAVVGARRQAMEHRIDVDPHWPRAELQARSHERDRLGWAAEEGRDAGAVVRRAPRVLVGRTVRQPVVET